VVSNKTTLLSLLAGHSIPTRDCGIAKEKANALLEKVLGIPDVGNVLVSTGVVSMGLKKVLSALDVGNVLISTAVVSIVDGDILPVLCVWLPCLSGTALQVRLNTQILISFPHA
jgi:hypothetical protein